MPIVGTNDSKILLPSQQTSIIRVVCKNKAAILAIYIWSMKSFGLTIMVQRLWTVEGSVLRN